MRCGKVMSHPVQPDVIDSVISVASISKYKNAVALLFGFAIAIAFSCSMLCSFRDKLDNHHEHDHNTAPHQPIANDGHHKGHSALEETANDLCHHKSGNESQADCCQDLTKHFYQSLTKISEPGDYQYYGGIADCILRGENLRPCLIVGKRADSYFSWCRPPTLSGYHLRILMSSFII